MQYTCLKSKCSRQIDSSSFTPNIALPNGSALLGVLSLSGDKGMQPSQGALVGSDQGADDYALSSANLHPPLTAARPREHFLHLLLLPPHPLHSLHNLGLGGEAKHVEGDVERKVGSVSAGERCQRVGSRVKTDRGQFHPETTFALTNAFRLLIVSSTALTLQDGLPVAEEKLCKHMLFGTQTFQNKCW